MDFFSKNKALTLTVILLVILNLVSIGTILFREFRPDPRPFDRMGDRMERMPGRIGGFLERELRLSPEQIEKMQGYRVDHFEKMRALEMQVRSTKKQIMDMALQAGAAGEEIDSLASQIGDLNRQISLVNIEHFRLISSVLDSNQVRLFKELIGEAMPFRGPHPNREEMMEKRREMRKRDKKKVDSR